ncbi:hypothetical protein RugamoR1_21780 [Rugamonas sp. R1(2021)]
MRPLHSEIATPEPVPTGTATSATKLFETVQQFGAHMSAPVAPPDSVLTVRVIGEFSAGKTRFLRELLGPCIPVALLPISSLERQTRLPLEITYGPEAELLLVERPHDAKPGVPLASYEHFPHRAELSAFDPMRHRLRLAVPESRLILRQGDGYGEGARRLALIDMPGWNSGDDALAESDASTLLTGHWNLALGYVCQASRLDGEWNQDRLTEFLQAIAGADFIGDRCSLLFIITQCPSEDRSRLEALARARVLEAWSELDEEPEQLDLLVLSADFSAMSLAELQWFRQSCWRHLLAPLQDEQEPQHPWLPAIQAWSDEWAIRPRLQLTQQVLERAGMMLYKARKGDEFLGGMNMYRLIGLGDAERYAKLQAAWLRQLGADVQQDTRLMLDGLELPSDHPLHAWWTHYWLPQLNATLAPARYFFAAADLAFRDLSADAPDLQQYLQKGLASPYATAISQMNSGFVRLIDTSRALVGEAAPQKVVATLLTLSMLHVSSEPYIETSS